MDKAYMKSILREHELPVVEDLVVYGVDWVSSPGDLMARIEEKLSYPVFTKPANLGSSVGVSKVNAREELRPALEEAFRYDRKAIVEQGIDAREIECSVLGNDEPVASLPGEIVPAGEFYDYRAKYIDDDSELLIPAPLSKSETEQVQAVGDVAAFRALDVSGMARVDFLLDRSNKKVYVNELNTIPGFTSISMYPKLWEATGVPMTKLVDRLIELALEKAKSRVRIADVVLGRDCVSLESQLSTFVVIISVKLDSICTKGANDAVLRDRAEVALKLTFSIQREKMIGGAKNA